MNKRELYRRERKLKQAGIDPDTGAVKLHNSNETVKHAVVKTLLAMAIQEKGRPWATEVRIPDVGVVDVLDFGPPDGKAVVYEVETDANPRRIVEKMEQYEKSWIVRDVIVVDPTDCPDDLSEAREWATQFVTG